MRPCAHRGAVPQKTAPSVTATHFMALAAFTSHLALRTLHFAPRTAHYARSLAEQLNQIVRGFLRLHVHELRHDVLLHLRILLAAREGDKARGVVLDEEGVDHGLADLGVAVGTIDGDQRVAGVGAAHLPELANRRAAQFRILLDFGDFDQLVALPADEHAVENLLLDLGRLLTAIEL